VKVTADTNIYISALYFRGKPLSLLHMAIDQDLRIAISPPILEETLRVMRDKFRATAKDIYEAEVLLLNCAELYHPTTTLDTVKEDPSDNRILECAVDSGSDYVVSGDGDLLRLKEHNSIKIVTVSELLAILANS